MHEFDRLPQLTTRNTMINVKLRWHPCGSFTVPLLISSASERSYIHRKLFSQVSVLQLENAELFWTLLSLGCPQRCNVVGGWSSALLSCLEFDFLQSSQEVPTKSQDMCCLMVCWVPPAVSVEDCQGEKILGLNVINLWTLLEMGFLNI